MASRDANGLSGGYILPPRQVGILAAALRLRYNSPIVQPSEPQPAEIPIPLSARGSRSIGTKIDVPSYTGEGHPWDRRSTESSAAYAAFCLFRDLGVERTVTAVGAELGHGDAKSCSKWSSGNEWLARAMAYDDYLEAEKRKAFEAESRAMAQRQAKLGMKFQAIAEAGADVLKLEEMTPQDIARLADTGVKIERLARGDSTENSGQVIAVRWEGPMPGWAAGSALAGVSQSTPRLPVPTPASAEEEGEGKP